ncbi:MAG TPA: BrnA antitoxin family protein [Thermoanaerobaculia bacterium]|nr:BrnA antitoxin family protein [Thermoanaerobaculia bacterium]
MRREYDFSKGKRGAVVAPAPGKVRITIRLDEDVIDWFREQVNAAGGGNYQSLINKALREYIEHRTEPLEKTLRRVIREELKKKGAA